MIGLLDPALFLHRSGTAAAREVEQDFGFVAQACRQHSILLPELSDYWPYMWTHLGSHLERDLDAPAKRALQQVRKLGTRSLLPPIPIGTKVWRRGFTQLFSERALGTDLEDMMARATAHAAASGQDVVLFTRRIENRNLQIHRVGDSALHENTRWVLHVQAPGVGHKRVLCVYHQRNLSDQWTTRFDWRLPGSGSYPFQPPGLWWNPDTEAWRTIRSKHAWIDRFGNGWARPNIRDGAGYHWDRFSQNPEPHVDHLNIVAYGVPSSEGTPGEIHH